MPHHHGLKKHTCTVHSSDIVGRLEPLVPGIDEVDTPVQPTELADWITVEAENEPEIEGHGWRVEWDDTVGILIHPDRDDVETLLAKQPGVRSAVQLDREVLVVSAPELCADGVHAAVMLAVAAANERVHEPAPAHQSFEGGGAAPGTAAATQAASSTAEDDAASRLVTGNARSEGRTVQMWVNQDGILILPAQTIPHDALDPSENPHFQRARITSDRAARLAERHAGNWIPYPYLGQLELRRPSLLRRRWKAKITERSGTSVSVTWHGTRPHALVLWGYVVAKGGMGKVNGLP